MAEPTKVVPDGDGCYILRVFGESITCPDLDDKEVRGPRCRKYCVGLGWTVSGRILKCDKCLEEVG